MPEDQNNNDLMPPLSGAPLTPGEIRAEILEHLRHAVGKDPEHALIHDWRTALTLVVRARIVAPWIEATNRTYALDGKRVYYLSMEFLIGRLLEDAINNIGLDEAVREAVAGLGLDYGALLHDEPDAALGNGGLGRLAACYLDSLSTLGVPTHGYGIRYENGLFKQSIVDGRQAEEPETWLLQPHVWEFPRTEVRYQVGFGGAAHEVDGRMVWTPEECVIAQGHDTPTIGWQGRWANTLRLWAAMPVRVLDLAAFNRGDYLGAASQEELARSISRVLYPDDTTEAGKTLRLKQEYFFTAASLADILHRYLSQHDDLSGLPGKVAIQLNDTHPALAGPELVRLLHDEHGMAFEQAIETAQATLAYTNHTLLPEALERWHEGLMWHLLPRHMQIIERIDDWHARRHPDRRTGLREHGEVKMGDLAFVMAHKVNGVSALHTELMRETVFHELDRLEPGRIVNETNGITPRRWVNTCNRPLARLIDAAIGEGWVSDLERISALEPLVEDAGFLEDFGRVKHQNKQALADHVARTQGIVLDPAALFDVQVKRIHEYKRQHLNILETIAHWQAIRDNPGAGWTPRVKIFGGKAAPGYWLAKDIIHLINSVARVVNADPVTSDLLKVAFLPDYNVTLAERIMPAADLSEQISTAGMEASGTGNMKLALNGALTIGTLDGANVEIRERVGEENFFLFGLTAEEVAARRHEPDHAMQAIRATPALARALAEIDAGTFSNGAPHMFASITGNLKASDWFLVCSDFAAYHQTQRAVDAAFADRAGWLRKAALNTARMGWFSSDRAVRGYMADIWNVAPLA